MTNLSEQGNREAEKQEHIIKLEHVSMERNGRQLLKDINWEIDPDENWLVSGRNGSGKSLLMMIMLGKLPCSRGNITYGNESILTRIAHVSFELESRLIAYEQDHDPVREFAGYKEKGTTVRNLLTKKAGDGNIQSEFDRIVGLLNLAQHLDSTLVTLSNGELRKTLIAKALLSFPSLIVLDEPFDGLDTDSKKHLLDIIRRVMSSGVQVILITHHLDEIPENITHCLVMEKGEIASIGSKSDFLKTRSGEKTINAADGKQEKRTFNNPIGKEPAVNTDDPNEIKILMKDVTVAYGEKKVLDRLDWCVRQREHWAIVGPNGAGKTTLLKLISADHPQAYSNEIYLFGIKRGSGETIWDIKRRIGLLSPELQIAYRTNLKVLDIVLSGFFDSIGLYRYTTNAQADRARALLDSMGIARLSDSYFNFLSYGEKRMVLLVRALVKSPDLLIMDEPCQGLDPDNSMQLIGLIDSIARSEKTQVLFVTHRRNELPSCITNVLEFVKADNEPESAERYTISTSCIKHEGLMTGAVLNTKQIGGVTGAEPPLWG